MALPPIDGPPIVSDEAYAETMVREPRPARNVVLVLLESVPARALGCYGYPRDVSPHIDAIAAGGIVFENALASETLANLAPTVSPRRASSRCLRLNGPPDSRPWNPRTSAARGANAEATIASYYRGRFASKIMDKIVYNWEEVKC